MEDSELTRKAVEELVKEINENKEAELTPGERKKNPLGKPNKLFLGRTINSILKHNKRQSDRNLRRSERKLKELDDRHRKQKIRKYRAVHHSKSKILSEVISIDSCDDTYEHKPTKNSKKKKKRKKKQRRYSTSSYSSTSSSTRTDSSNGHKNLETRNSSRKKKKYKKRSKNDNEYTEELYSDCVNNTTVGYYIDPNITYTAMAYEQINNMILQQQMFLQQINKAELEESVKVLSDVSISCNSGTESSLNISLNSSSAEEDENGILTFKLSSDDENISNSSQHLNLKTTNNKEDESSILNVDELDVHSVHSHISLDSEDCRNAVFNQPNEVYLLSSSCSNSDELEIVETLAEI